MSPTPSMLQMQRIQEEDAKIKEQEAKDRKPEELVKSHLCDFKIERYLTTDLRGMFEITQVIYKDGKRMHSRRIIEGVFLEEAMNALQKALEWRVYQMK